VVVGIVILADGAGDDADVRPAFGDQAGQDVKGRKLRYTLGAGSRVVHAYALNGEVALRKLDAQGRSY